MIFSRKFFPLFWIQTLGVFNDTIFRSAAAIVITFNVSSLTFSKNVQINIAMILFNLPYLLLSSYCGRIVNSYDKKRITQLVKLLEIAIVIIMWIAIVQKHTPLMFLALFCLGMHSAIFSPIKFVILPEYFPEIQKVKIATAYVEVGIFVAVLFGNVITTELLSRQLTMTLIGVMGLNAIIGMILSFIMDRGANNQLASRVSYYLNPIKDFLSSYQSVDFESKKFVWIISWFWAFSFIYMGQLTRLSKYHLNASISSYNLIVIALFTGIVIGSLYSGYSKLNNKRVIIIATVIANVGLIYLLCTNFTHYKNLQYSLAYYTSHFDTMIDVVLLAIIGFGIGAYSTSSYNQLIMVTKHNQLADVIALTNQISGLIILLIAIFSALFAQLIDSWWFLFIAAILNLVFNFMTLDFSCKKTNKIN